MLHLNTASEFKDILPCCMSMIYLSLSTCEQFNSPFIKKKFFSGGGETWSKEGGLVRGGGETDLTRGEMTSIVLVSNKLLVNSVPIPSIHPPL